MIHDPQNVAPESEKNSSLRQKMILLTIGVVLVMLALPFAILGWVARDYIGPRFEQSRPPTSDTAELAPELRANLEVIAESWQALPTLESPIPEITFFLKKPQEGNKIIPEIVQHLEDQGITLLALDPEPASKAERYMALANFKKIVTILSDKKKYSFNIQSDTGGHLSTIIQFLPLYKSENEAGADGKLP